MAIQLLIVIALWVLWPIVPANAQAAAPDEQDTMIVIDADFLPEDIVNVIRLPVEAQGAAGAAAAAGLQDGSSQPRGAGHDSASAVAEAARGDARRSDTAREARSAAADAADAASEARDAAAELRGNARENRPARPERPERPERELPEPAGGA